MENQPPITPATPAEAPQTPAPAPAEPQAPAQDLAAELEAANAKVKTAEENAANYQKAALRFKSKYKKLKNGEEPDLDDDDEDIDIDRVVDAEVQARTATAAANAERERRDQLAADLLKQNAELKARLANPVPAPAAAGGKADTNPAPLAPGETDPATYFTPAQLQDLKNRGLDPAQVMKNMPGVATAMPAMAGTPPPADPL